MDSAGLKALLETPSVSQHTVEKLLESLGYSIVPSVEQTLDSDLLFQEKDKREKIRSSKKLFSTKASMVHPATKQSFEREAVIMLFEVKDENTLRSKITFDITRYVVKYSMLTAQGLFFFIAPNSRTMVITAYTQSIQIPEQVQVRRLVIDTSNIVRTDIDSIIDLEKPSDSSIIEKFRLALPYLKVGHDFFKAYHENFQLLSKRLKKVFDSKEEAYGFAQRFLGRITFLYFLQRKGWLENNRAYLKALAEVNNGNDIFNTLYRLFDSLNNENRDLPSKSNVPYLNGSLFEREPFSKNKMEDIAEATSALLPDILKMFNQYNFTISESTPLNKEVAVDPELLGSIFESMLPDAERGDKGTFYTHQEEMLFMAKEAIRKVLELYSGFLSNDQIFYLVYGHKSQSGTYKVEPKVARELKESISKIRMLDPASGSGGFLIAMLQALLEIRTRLNAAIGTLEQDYDSKLQIIQNNLFGVDIEYEAVELARLRLWLTLVVDESLENVRPLPNLDFNLHQGDSLIIPEFEKSHQTRLTDIDIRNALLRQISAMREKYAGSHGKEKESIKTELERALLKLLQLETGEKYKVPPFSYKFFFADVMASGGFDIVLMNPPFITQEEIGRLHGQDPRNYKNQVMKDVQLLTTNQFVPNGQSDISVYFHIRALTLLKPRGVAVVIATNKWLDVRYGIKLQEYLLKSVFLDCIYDSVERSFSADVNTVITVMRRLNDKDNPRQNLTRFVSLKVPFQDVTSSMLMDLWSISDTGSKLYGNMKITIRTQQQLFDDGLISREDLADEDDQSEQTSTLFDESPPSSDSVYVGTKWGNLHIYAPDIYQIILQKGGKKFAPMQSAYFVKRGVTTGVNAFFILKELPPHKSSNILRLVNGFGKELFLEKQFCPPVLMRPDEDQPCELKRGSVKLRLFKCREDRSALKGTYALKYIQWAESSPDAFIEVRQGKDKGKKKRITELSTLKARSDWYKLPDVKPTNIIAPQGIKNKQSVFFSKEPIHFEHRFYGIYADDATDLWLYLNSSIFRLFLELNGRTEGAGALGVMVYEYKKCPVLNPMPLISDKFKSLETFRSRPQHRFVNIKEPAALEFDQSDRKELDNIILKEIGFSGEERAVVLDQLYQWLRDRVYHRLTKPDTAPESVAKGVAKKKMNTDLREFQ